MQAILVALQKVCKISIAKAVKFVIYYNYLGGAAQSAPAQEEWKWKDTFL